MKNNKIKNFNQFYKELASGIIDEYIQVHGHITIEQPEYDEIIWHPEKGYYFTRFRRQYNVLTAFGNYTTSNYAEAAKHLWHNFVKHEEGFEEVSLDFANELAITSQIMSSFEEYGPSPNSVDKIVSISKDFIDKYPTNTDWELEENDWETTMYLFHKEWHDNQNYLNEEMEIWVEGHWDLPWESDGRKRPINVYSIGEVIVVKRKELKDKVDELEKMGASYLIPNAYTSAKWNGKIKYIGHKTNSNR